MAKTTFINGTTVTPAFLNAINAHVHDGADTDGHAAKINLTSAANISGLLPVLNRVPLRNFIDGLRLENEADRYDIEINPGMCAESGNAVMMVLAAALVKQIDAAWTAGSAAGGFPSAGGSGITLTDATWYHVFVIAKADGTVDAGFDSSLTAEHLLNADNAGAADYVYYRRVGSVFYIDSTDKIASFKQRGDSFEFVYGLTAAGWEIETFTWTVASAGYQALKKIPPGISVLARLAIKVITGAEAHLAFGSFNAAGNCPYVVFASASFAAGPERGEPVTLRTDESQQISWTRSVVGGSAADTTVHIAVAGYEDSRGKE
jgi:hypothetical protein